MIIAPSIIAKKPWYYSSTKTKKHRQHVGQQFAKTLTEIIFYLIIEQNVNVDIKENNTQR